MEAATTAAPSHRPSTTPSRFRRLRDLIEGPELGFLMEAHSGLSAKLVEEAGFAGIWGSGLSMSAALGLRDNNEASWTQVLEQAEYMADATAACRSCSTAIPATATSTTSAGWCAS